MGAFNQLNGAIFDAGAIEARISAVDGKGIYNQRDGATLDLDSLARRLTALDGKVAAGQGGIEFDVDAFMRRLAAIEAGGFNPLSLFAQGQQGVWYDPSDFSTMFQDSAGTTPVTAVGQPVGKLLDKSGRANHAVQATAANRPVLQQDANGMFYLAFNGTNSSIAAATNVDFSATAQMTVVGGLYSATLTSGVVAMAVNSNGTGFNAMSLQVPDVNSGEITFIIAGNSGISGSPLSGQASPFLAVLTGQVDIGASTQSLRKNGAPGSTATPSVGGGNFANAPFSVGVQSNSATRFFNGRIYSLIVRGAASNGQEVVNAENWVNGKTRAY